MEEKQTNGLDESAEKLAEKPDESTEKPEAGSDQGGAPKFPAGWLLCDTIPSDLPVPETKEAVSKKDRNRENQKATLVYTKHAKIYNIAILACAIIMLVFAVVALFAPVYEFSGYYEENGFIAESVEGDEVTSGHYVKVGQSGLQVFKSFAYIGMGEETKAEIQTEHSVAIAEAQKEYLSWLATNPNVDELTAADKFEQIYSDSLSEINYVAYIAMSSNIEPILLSGLYALCIILFALIAGILLLVHSVKAILANDGKCVFYQSIVGLDVFPLTLVFLKIFVMFASINIGFAIISFLIPIIARAFVGCHYAIKERKLDAKLICLSLVGPILYILTAVFFCLDFTVVSDNSVTYSMPCGIGASIGGTFIDTARSDNKTWFAVYIVCIVALLACALLYKKLMVKKYGSMATYIRHKQKVTGNRTFTEMGIIALVFTILTIILAVVAGKYNGVTTVGVSINAYGYLAIVFGVCAVAFGYAYRIISKKRSVAKVQA